MILTAMHPEDIKAEIRKRFRSVAEFERTHGLPAKSVTDLMRGYKSARVAEAIEAAIKTPIPGQSEYSVPTSEMSVAHRQNSEA